MLLYHLFMGGVNRDNQLQERGAGFSLKGHFQKWYKKAYLGILDFMR